MPRPHLLLPLLVAGILTLGAAPHAQFPKLHIPKVPSVPGVKQTAPQPAAKMNGITDDVITRFLTAKKAEKAALDREIAAAKAKKAAVEEAQKKRAERMVAEMMKLSDCKDPIVEKDPRSKEVSRLNKLAEEASAKGNDKQSEEYSQQASALSNKIDIAADKACGGKTSSLLADCREKFEAKDPRAAERDKLRRQADEASKKGNSKASEDYDAQAKQLSAQIEVESLGECQQQMTAAQLGPGAAEEQQASNDASNALQHASSTAQKEGAAAGQFTDDEYARVFEIIVMHLNGAKTDDASDAAIDKRAPELKAAINGK